MHAAEMTLSFLFPWIFLSLALFFWNLLADGWNDLATKEYLAMPVISCIVFIPTFVWYRRKRREGPVAVLDVQTLALSPTEEHHPAPSCVQEIEPAGPVS